MKRLTLVNREVGDVRKWQIPRSLRYVLTGACLGLGIFALHKATPLMPWAIANSHFVAPATCDDARTWGIAPMRRGEPGYHRRPDPENNGVACEPYLASGRYRN